ncbi:MAG: ubiquinone-binding protein, partial [Shewanella sp.]
NSFADLAFGKVFNDLMVSMVTAFTSRAKVIYSDK